MAGCRFLEPNINGAFARDGFVEEDVIGV